MYKSHDKYILVHTRVNTMSYKPFTMNLHNEKDAELIEALLAECDAQGVTVSRLLKAALVSYLGTPQEAATDLSALAGIIETAIERGIRAGLNGVTLASVESGGNSIENVAVDDSREDPDDALVKRFTGMSFENF